jgi:hypothetical protein
MNEVSAHEIAATLTGKPGAQWSELRLLMLFQSEAGERIDVEPVIGESLPKAA